MNDVPMSNNLKPDESLTKEYVKHRLSFSSGKYIVLSVENNEVRIEYLSLEALHACYSFMIYVAKAIEQNKNIRVLSYGREYEDIFFFECELVVLRNTFQEFFRQRGYKYLQHIKREPEYE